VFYVYMGQVPEIKLMMMMMMTFRWSLTTTCRDAASLVNQIRHMQTLQSKQIPRPFAPPRRLTGTYHARRTVCVSNNCSAI